MIIDPEKLTIFISYAEFDWRDKNDPVVQICEEKFGEILNRVLVADLTPVYICKGKP